MGNLRLAGWALALGLFGAGCADSTAPTQMPTNLIVGVEDRPYLRVSPANLELLARPEQWLELVHVGRRRVSFYDADGNENAFIERVATDGTGRFAIEPVEPVTALESAWDAFYLRQLSQQGFIFRYRDFAIRDLALFESNWVLEELEYNSTIAGRRCDLFHAKRTDVSDAPSYQVLIDSNGLVLAYREVDAQGALVSEMRYISINLDPSSETLDQVIWYEPVAEQIEELECAQPLAGQLPQLFGPLLQPRWLPGGFSMRRASRARVGEDTWLRLAYTDGVETLLFAATLGLGPGNNEGEIPFPFVPTNTQDMVRTYSIGRTSALQGTLRHRDVMALGKVSSELLLDLVQSSLP